jgi:hypothetical protein
LIQQQNEKKPLFFINQSGFHQISLPPRHVRENNFDVINITSCDDGVLITTDMDFEVAVEKLNEFTGHPVVEIWCDTNEIEDGGYFRGAEITTGNYGERVICLHWWKETQVEYKKDQYLYCHQQKETFQIEEVEAQGFVLRNARGDLKRESNLTAYRFATMKERE